MAIKTTYIKTTNVNKTNTFAGNLTISGNLTFGNAVIDSLIISGRVSTSTVAGANLELDSTYTYGELVEMRTKVTSWSGIGDSFKGFYFRAENGVAGSGKGLRCIEAYAIANATFSIDNLQAGYFEIGMKTSGTQTIANANALEASLAPYGGTGAITITNHWECILCTPSGVSSRIDTANAAKIHGIYLLARDGDGGNTKLGDGFYMGNDTGQSGTRTLTNGINIAIGCTTGINIAGACTVAGISMNSATFAAGDNEIEMRNTVSGDKTVIASGAAANDAEIVTAVGADADIADGSLYLQVIDGAGALYIKKNDVWTAFTNP